MPDTLRILPAGDEAVLVVMGNLDSALALQQQLASAPPDGFRETVLGAETLLVRFDPYLTDPANIAAEISSFDVVASPQSSTDQIEIPTVYDGEDLAEVARQWGVTVAEVIRRHEATVFTVGFGGFVPGFAYLIPDDPTCTALRRVSPRARVPAGSVALGGAYCGIYPSESPGGWQLIGRTERRVWDLARNPPSLFAAGQRVVFRGVTAKRPIAARLTSEAAVNAAKHPDRPALLVAKTERAAFFQDLGRHGWAGQGVSTSGALDRKALVTANAAVGNPDSATAIEIYHGGFELVSQTEVTVAVAGAPVPLVLTTSDGRRLLVASHAAIALDSGDRLSLGLPSTGTRSYLALRGGFAVQPMLGSTATDTLSGIGPEPVRTGQVLGSAGLATTAVSALPARVPSLPSASDVVELHLRPGPRLDWFTSEAIEALCSQDWEVTPATSRVGARLRGAQPLTRAVTQELKSEGTPRGAIQIPHDGQPVIFLSDHPVTGGYPVIAVLARCHRDLAGQVPVGARIRFRWIDGPSPTNEDAP